MIIIEATGPLAVLQDRGRQGLAGVGVSRSGSFDRIAADLANRLVGNSASDAVIETLGAGLRVATTIATTLAVTGAEGELLLDGRPVPRRTALRVRPGALLELGRTGRGLRSYVSVRGGIVVPAVLGSRSWDSLGTLGPAPLVAGQELPVGPPILPPAPIDHAASKAAALPIVLPVVPGPRRDWFPDDTWRRLVGHTFVVHASSNRVGIRLRGPALARTSDRVGSELPPEGLVLGAVQVPPDGQPIIMGPDHPTTGGYPVIAVVREREVSWCGQLAPGDEVRLSDTLFAGR